MANTTPYDLTIRTIPADEAYDPEHVAIEIHTAYDLENPQHSYADTLAGFRWCAGVMCRTALSLTPKLQRTADNHLCGERGHCGATFNEWAGPEIINGGPFLTIELPHTVDLDAWLKLVTDRLNDLIEADRWQPTAEDEVEWSAAE